MTDFVYNEEKRVWVWETELTGPGVIYVDRPRSGLLSIEQSHVGDPDKYSPVGTRTYFDALVDVAMVDPAGVYPVYLRLTSDVPVDNNSILYGSGS